MLQYVRYIHWLEKKSHDFVAGPRIPPPRLVFHRGKRKKMQGLGEGKKGSP